MARLKEHFIFDTRYKLIKKLGEGGFAEVWLAEDISTQLTLVLKVYLHTSKLDEYGAESFRKEFALVYNLNHPNLMKYTYFGICVGYPYLVMPYYDSGSAEDMIGNCSERTAWRFLRDVASGLACLHEQHPAIIHQDIKPANVLLDGRQYVITDFGISDNAMRRAIYGQNGDSHTQTGMGTVPYMAPERFEQNGQPLLAGDIWSLGASLYEILSGKLPFGNEGGKAQARGVELPPLSDTFSEELRSIIYQCMSREPVKRPFADDLYKFANAQLEKQAFTTSSIHNTSGGGIKHNIDVKRKSMGMLWTIVAFVVVLLGIGIGGWMVYSNHKEKQEQEAYENAMKEFHQGKSLYDLAVKNCQNQVGNFENAVNHLNVALQSESFMETEYGDSVRMINNLILDACVAEAKKNISGAYYDEGERAYVLSYLAVAEKINPENQDVVALKESITHLK